MVRGWAFGWWLDQAKDSTEEPVDKSGETDVRLVRAADA